MIQRISRAEENCQTQSGPKHRKKSSDLRRRLKAVSDVDEVTLDGRLFHTHEAMTGFSDFQSKHTSNSLTVYKQTVTGMQKSSSDPQFEPK